MAQLMHVRCAIDACCLNINLDSGSNVDATSAMKGFHGTRIYYIYIHYYSWAEFLHACMHCMHDNSAGVWGA